jgi:hypothetical protein
MIFIIVVGLPFLIGAIIYSFKIDKFDKKSEALIKEFNKYIKETQCKTK